nr:hypothetical protein [Tanacetum cinerariifolium]
MLHGCPPHQPPPSPTPAGPSRSSGAPGASGSSQVPPQPPPPSSTNPESSSTGSATPSSSKTATSTEYQAWTTTEIRLRPSISLTPADLEMDADMAPDEPTQSSDDEDIGSAHISKASALASNYSPPHEDSLLAQTGDFATFMDCVDDPILRHNINKPLPLGGPPGQVTIQSDFFFNNDLEYLRYGSKGRRPVLSILKMKAAYYLDAGLEQMVPDLFWIEEEYDYMKKIVLRHTDLNEHVIAERDFKYLYPSDFEDLYMLNLQGHLNHLPPKDKKIFNMAVNQWTRHLVIRQRVEDFQLGIESYQTQLNLTKPQWDATGFEYKHDYTVIDSPRAVMFRDKYRSKYEVLDQEGRGSEQGVHVRYSEAFKDKEDLLQPGDLCWWTYLQHSFRDSDVCCYVQEKYGYGVLMSQPHKMAMLHNKDDQEMYCG